MDVKFNQANPILKGNEFSRSNQQLTIQKKLGNKQTHKQWTNYLWIELKCWNCLFDSNWIIFLQVNYWIVEYHHLKIWHSYWNWIEFI